MKIQYLILLFSLSVSTTFGQKKDTIYLLTHNNIKYWDKVYTFLASKGVKNICWRFTKKSKTILEYYYSKSNMKIRHENNYGDFILGETLFAVKFDTLLLPEIKEKFVIKSLTEDSLIIREFKKGFLGNDILFLKSKDQSRIPIPVLSNITRPKKL
ncbi:MAG TPA: hypothetical protein VGO09_11900, partial [Flavisolibacter sp.]|nr:hypothetical protein [Flavisolibacter sp.]